MRISTRHVTRGAILATLIASPLSHGNNCTTGAKAAADVWNKYDEVVKQVGCVSAAAAITVGSGGAALPAAAATYAECFNKANTANQATKGVIKGWNDLNRNGWGNIGPRQLEVGKHYNGTIAGGTTRMYISAPVTSEMLKLELKRLDKGVFNTGDATVTVCKFPPEGPGVEVDGDELWSFYAESGRQNRGKTWENTIGARGHVLTVALKSEGPKAFKYRVEATPLAARHTLVVESEEVQGDTDYRLSVSDRIEQIVGFVDGFEVSGGDQVQGNRAQGRVGSGNDAYWFNGSLQEVALSNPDHARVYVDGMPHGDFIADHTVVIDGRGSDGGSDYTIVASDRIDQVESRVGVVELTINAADSVDGNRAEGHVGGGADGFIVKGEIERVALEDSDAATVYVDGNEYEPDRHAGQLVVIDGTAGDGSTGYRIVAGKSIRQLDGKVLGKSVSIQGNDDVSGNTATGEVAAGADGFSIEGGIRSIEIDDASAAALHVDSP